MQRIYERMVAKAIEGREYCYSRRSAHAVPKSSAQAICDALNESRYDLKPGEVWHVYDMGWYERDHTNAGVQSFSRRKGAIYRSRYA